MSKKRILDLSKIQWESINKAAAESVWMPSQYCSNDWVSDICRFLKEGPDAFIPNQFKWQPIKTAPYATEVLISGFNHNRKEDGRWVAFAIREDEGWYDPNGDKTEFYYTPTHWMPIPEPPIDDK